MAEKKKNKEEITEIFEIEKDGKEKEVKVKGVIDSEEGSKKERKKNNRQLKWILVGIVFVILFIVFFIIFSNAMKQFGYMGTKFEIVREGELILYKTSLPVVYNGEKTQYNFYLRNDPRKLESIPFNGELNLLENAVINMSQSFDCSGDGIISIANLARQYSVIGVNMIKDESAGCDEEGKYMFIQILEGNETKIEKFGTSCYNIYVNNCEILKSTERFMVETFVKVNEKLFPDE